MSDRKTPEQRANDYESTQSTFMGQQRIFQAFLAGRADFIKNELPKLLEMAREGVFMGACNMWHWEHETADLLAMAERSE